MTSSQRNKKIIIDTDCGGDDLVGILAAAADPNVEIVALTAVWGNVSVEQGARNLGVVADSISAAQFGTDIPIFIGADRPLLGGERETTQWYGFGTDGAGDAGFDVSPRVEWAKKKPHAALALVDILSSIKDNDPNLWQIYAIGPLTNVAMALNLRPNLFRRLGDPATGDPGVIVMGGAMHCKGNANLASEFNFACDPEAARVLFNNKSLRMPIMVISWELTVDAALPWELFDKILGRAPTKPKSSSSISSSSNTVGVAGSAPASLAASVRHQTPLWMDEIGRLERNERIGAFLGKILKKFEEVSRPKEVDLGEDERTQVSCVVCDAVAIAVGLNPSLVKEKVRTYANVELAGSMTRGALCTSWYGNEKSLAAKGQWVNADIVTKIDLERMLVSIARITHIGKEPKN